MPPKPACPKCGSADVRVIEHNDVSFIRCSSCGFDELAPEQIFPEGRTSQREKGRFSPYKTGGKGRAQKKPIR